MNNLWAILFYAGILLITTGGFIAILSGVDVESGSYPVKIPVSEVRVKPPGNYTTYRVIEVNKTEVRLQDRGPVEAVLDLEPPPVYCIKVNRHLTIEGEGTIYTSRVAMLRVDMTLESPNWTNTTESILAFDPEKITSITESIASTAHAIVTSPVMVESKGILNGYAHVNEETNGLYSLSINIRGALHPIEIPPDTTRITINIDSNMTSGEVVLSIRVADRCTYKYEQKYPIPEAYTRYDSVYIPVVRGINMQGLKASIAFIALGNALTMISIYRMLKELKIKEYNSVTT